MTRRRSVRRPRRVQVQFWRRGEAQGYPGYTTNISTTGMFLATNSPQPPGTRLRIEVTEGSSGFVVEGVVAHARRVRAEMMRLSHPGMGIRFLTVEELVRELIPVLPGETEEIPETEKFASITGGFSAATSQPLPIPPSPVPMPPATPAPSPPPVPPPPRAAAATRAVVPPAATLPPLRPQDTNGRPIPKPIEGAGVFSVQFLGPAELVEVYQRDIVNGGLFISTRYPGRLQETVKVDLLPPVAGAEPISFRARVVQRFEPQGGDFGPNLLAGMGVEILDLPTVLDRLKPVIDQLR